MSHHHGPLLAPGTIVGGIWEAGERLGHGTFSEIFLGTHLLSKARCALKVDRPGPRLALQWESDVLRKLNKYPFAARHYGLFNMPDGKLQVLAMQLLGNSISALRRKQPDSFMPYGSVCHIVLQMLASVEALHQEGYIHRDLKPSNFVHGLGRAGKKQVYVIDFGQSRMFVDEEGNVRPPRPMADFRGTSLYSSLHAHQLKDLGRRDDLWALWYIFFELARGGLPWKCCKEDRYRCEIAKGYYMAHPEELTAGLPGEAHLLALHAHLRSVPFEGQPDYAFFAECLRGVLADAAAAGKLLQRTWASYKENELWAMHFDESMYHSHSHHHHTLHAAATAAAAAAAGGSSAVPAVGAAAAPKSPPKPGSTVLFWNSELSAACFPAHHTLQTLAVMDRSGESAELLALFDQSETPYSSDCVLECRGGLPYQWETDQAGTPIYVALRSNEHTDLTPESEAVMENLRRERAAFQALLDRPFAAGLAAGGAASGGAAAGGGLGLVGHGGSLSVRPVDASSASTGGAAAAASQAPARHPFELREGEDDGLSPSTGRKRRRTGEVALLDYTGKGDGFVVSDLTQRLQDLGGVLEKALAEAGARGSLLAPGAAAAAAAGEATAPASTSSSTASSAAASAAGGAAAPAAAPPSPDPALVARACVSYALAWRRIAEAALARFEAPCKAAETVRGDVQTLFKRLLEASVAVPPASFASAEAAAAAAAGAPSSTEAGLGVSPAVALANDVLASAGGLLALPYPTPADRMTLQLGLSRVEAWVKGNKAKPQPLAAVTSLADTAAAFVPVSAAGEGGDAAAAAAAAVAARPGSATDEATATLLGSSAAAAAAASSAAGAAGGVGAVERERELRRTALERVQTLSTLLKALDRERDLMRAPYAPDGWKSRSGFVPPLHIQQQYAAAIAHLTGGSGAGAVSAPAAPLAASAAAPSSGRSAPGAVAPLQGRVMPGAPGGAFFGGASIGGGSGGGSGGFAPVGSSAGAAGDVSGRAPAPGPGASSGAASAPPPSGTLFTPLSSALSSALHFGASDGAKATGALPAPAAVAGAEPARKRSRWDAAAGGAAAPAGDDMDMGK